MKLIEDWPITLYGRITHNLSAEDTTTGKEENLAWSAGVDFGDKKKWLKLGFGYFRLPANAVPSSLIDSDLFDGHTNGKGFIVYWQKRVYGNVDVGMKLFSGKEIRDSLRDTSAADRYDRLRLQTDVKFAF